MDKWTAFGLLEKSLNDQKETLDLLGAYYSGNHPEPPTPVPLSAKLKKYLATAIENFMALVVDIHSEKLRVQGFRVDGETDNSKDAWDIWRKSKMVSRSTLMHKEAMTYGASYLMLTPRDGKTPLITVESPYEVDVIWNDTGERVLWSIKRYLTTEGKVRVNLYDDENVYRYESKETAQLWADRDAGDFNLWTNLDLTEESDTDITGTAHGVPGNPIHPILNSPTIANVGRSDLSPLIPNQDRINKLTFDMMMAAHNSAFAKRWGTGVSLDSVDEEDSDTQTDMTVSEDPDAKFGDFRTTDLAVYVTAKESEIQNMARRQRIPAFILSLTGEQASGESVKSSQVGELGMLKDKQDMTGDAIEDLMRKALTMYSVGEDDDEGGKDFSDTIIETVWEDAESRIESEYMNALIIRRELGVPFIQLWEDMGYSQEERDRFEGLLISEQIMNGILGLPDMVESEDPNDSTESTPQDNRVGTSSSSETDS